MNAAAFGFRQRRRSPRSGGAETSGSPTGGLQFSSPSFSFCLPLHTRRSSGSSTTSQPMHHSGPRLLPRLLRLLPSSNSFSPLLFFGGGGGFRGNPQGGGAVQGWLGRLLVGWLLGFEGASGWCRCGTGGTRPPSRGASAAGGGAHGWRRHGGPLAPTACARDKARNGKKELGKGANGGGPHGGETRRGGWQAARLAVLGRKSRWTARLGCGLVNPREEIGVL
jgi:hypothetical protein